MGPQPEVLILSPHARIEVRIGKNILTLDHPPMAPQPEVLILSPHVRTPVCMPPRLRMYVRIEVRIENLRSNFRNPG